MLPEVTQDNVYLFLPYKAAKISTAIRRDSQIGLKEALLSFYQSRWNRKIPNSGTVARNRSTRTICGRSHPVNAIIKMVRGIANLLRLQHKSIYGASTA